MGFKESGEEQRELRRGLKEKVRAEGKPQRMESMSKTSSLGNIPAGISSERPHLKECTPTVTTFQPTA